MTNTKLQAALDELERLQGTVAAYKERNGKLPDSDSDAYRALLLLKTFMDELRSRHLPKLID